MHFRIREAIPSDIDEIINLCAEHAEYERADYSYEGKAEKLAAFLFAEQPRLYCLIVEDNTGILGYATTCSNSLLGMLVSIHTWTACILGRTHAAAE